MTNSTTTPAKAEAKKTEVKAPLTVEQAKAVLDAEAKANEERIATMAKAEAEKMNTEVQALLAESVAFVVNGRRSMGFDLIQQWINTGEVLSTLKALTNSTKDYSDVITYYYGSVSFFSNNDRAYCVRLFKADNVEGQTIEEWYTDSKCTLASPKGVFEKMQKDTGVDKEGKEIDCFNGAEMIANSLGKEDKAEAKKKEATKKTNEAKKKKDAYKTDWEALDGTLQGYIKNHKSNAKAEELKESMEIRLKQFAKSMGLDLTK